ncbi:MAG: hypothetical protein AAF799_40770 [Myxococcota bacterium]
MSIARPTGLMLATLLAVGCRDAAPDVQVQTYVGPSYARHDQEQRQAYTVEVARTVWNDYLPQGKTVGPAEPEVETIAPVDVPATAEQFEQLVTALRKAPLDELDGPARRLAASSPTLWPQIREALLAERKSPKGDYRSMLDAIGGDVPNRYGHFARAWKKAHGHAVKLSDDWFEDLLVLPSGRISRGIRPVYRDLVLQTALFRAAAGIGATDSTLTGDVVATLLDAAYMLDGTFRDEVGRTIAAVGDEAVPHLIIESISPSTRRRDQDSVPVRRARYAEVQLDKMDRLHPSRTTEAVRDDPRRLTLVLHAYGTRRPGEAAAVLLQFADAADPSVRGAARASFAAFVTGPPPAVARRTVRLLGGGTANRQSHLTYRHRASIAIRERLELDAPELLEPACEIKREDGSIDTACETQPDRLSAAYFAWLDARREAADQKALAAALAEPDVRARASRLDALLVSNPELSLGDQLVPVYEQAAEAAEADGDLARAGQLLRKAARLAERQDPEHGKALRVRALLAEASVPALTPEGQSMLLSSAAVLAPHDPRVNDALTALDEHGVERAGTPQQRWIPVAGVAFGLWCLGAMGAWWRRRRRAPHPS